MNIDELPSLVKDLRTRSSELEAVRTALMEFSTAQADLVLIVEKMPKAVVEGLQSALANLKLGELQVNVPAPPPMPAPKWVLPDTPRVAWVFEHEYGPDGKFLRSVARPLT